MLSRPGTGSVSRVRGASAQPQEARAQDAQGFLGSVSSAGLE